MIPRVQTSVRGGRRKSTVRARTGPATGLVTKAQVRQMINSKMRYEEENKYFDTINSSSTDVNWNGITPVQLCNMAQGSSDTTRVGDEIIVKRLLWSATFVYDLTSTLTNLASSISVVRFIIFAWKPFFSDVAPTVAKLMTYTGTLYAAEGPLTHDGIDQFVILHDECFTVDGYTKPNRVARGNVALNHIVQYKAGSTTNMASGIYWTALSDRNSGAGVFPTVYHSAFRIDFTDN